MSNKATAVSSLGGSSLATGVVDQVTACSLARSASVGVMHFRGCVKMGMCKPHMCDHLVCTQQLSFVDSKQQHPPVSTAGN